MASNIIIQYTDQAQNNLDDILNYIINITSNKNAAIKLFSVFEKNIELLSVFPLLGTIYSCDFFESAIVRRLIVKKYFIYYDYLE